MDYEAEVVDSLWEIGRQQSEWLPRNTVLLKAVYRNGGFEYANILTFASDEDWKEYFQSEEVVPGYYNFSQRVIIFNYFLPTGNKNHLYAFYDDSFERVIDFFAQQGSQLEAKDFQFYLSRYVISRGDPGIAPPDLNANSKQKYPTPSTFTDTNGRSHLPSSIRRQLDLRSRQAPPFNSFMS